MVSVTDALHGAQHATRIPLRRSAVLAGAAGTLGAAVLEHALARAGFERVQVLVTGPVAAGMPGFQALTLEQLAMTSARPADTGFIVFDRARHANGREAAFLRPQPADLPVLARAMRAAGVARLLVVLPHAPSQLPQALKHGLATLDEQAVAALDFEHVVFVRSAQAAGAHAVQRSWPQRVAHAMLSQLHWMVPEQEQPVRAVRVAHLVAELARQLPHAPPGARVMGSDTVWHAARDADPAPRIHAWLHGLPFPSECRPSPAPSGATTR